MLITKIQFPTLLNSKTFITILIAVFASLTACKEDKEDEVSPEDRLPFIGTYDVKDKNTDEEAVVLDFTMKIDASNKGADKVDLKGFRYLNNGVYATIKGNKMIISQVMEDSNEKIEIKGEGTLSGNTLNYTYKIVLKQKGKQPRTFENSAVAVKLVD